MKNSSIVRVMAGLSAVSAMAAPYPCVAGDTRGDTASRTASGATRTRVHGVAPWSVEAAIATIVT